MTYSNKDEYYKVSGIFQEEIYTSLKQSRKWAWIFAGVCLGIALFSVLALVIVLPMKETEIIVVESEKATGRMDVAYKLSEAGKKLSQQDKFIRFELMRYMNAREGYFHPVQQKRYDLVVAMSEDRALDEYTTLYDINNPDNPSVVYGNGATIDVHFKSIEIEDDSQTARVRFERKLKTKNKEIDSHWIAIIKFNHQLSNKQNMKEIAINPLSFNVTGYRLEEENLEY